MNGEEGFDDSQEAGVLLQKVAGCQLLPLLRFPSGRKRQPVALPMVGKGLQGWTVAGGHVLQRCFWGTA